MRERLIDLVLECSTFTPEYAKQARLHAEYVAQHLLNAGVIVPPCKIGQTVYFPMETNGECEPYVDVGTVFCIGFDERHTMWISCRYEDGLKYYHTSDDFGKTVFLTREEAEKELKGGE